MEARSQLRHRPNFAGDTATSVADDSFILADPKELVNARKAN